MATARAPGKLMILGEHAVVYGRRCIVTAVDAGVQASVTDSESYFIDAPDMGFSGQVDLSQESFPKQIAFAAQAAKNFMQAFSVARPFRITTRSPDTPEKKVGLGSSASVTAATIAALASHFRVPLDEAKLYTLAYKTVLEVQKVGSGFDAAAASYGGTIMYKIGSPEPISPLAEQLVVAYTGQPASTPEIVSHVAEHVKNDQKFYNSLFDEIEKLVLMARTAIGRQDWRQLGVLMNHNQELLRKMKSPSTELGVSSEKIERLVAAALDAGAYGAKLSGAGVGDCIIALCPEALEANVKKSLQAAGGQIINARPNAAGACAV